MSVPFDTLQLARGFEAAGFPLDQASKMAEAVAQATIGADLATKADIALVRTDLAPLASKADLAAAKVELIKWFAGVMLVAVGLTLTGVGTATTIILNRLSAPAVSAPPAPQHASIVLAAESFDWDRYDARQDACREKDRIAAQCGIEGNPVFNSFVRRGVPEGYCDELALRQAQRQCSAFGPLGDKRTR